jgi:hypothetical protein
MVSSYREAPGMGESKVDFRCGDGPQADVWQYVMAFRRRWVLMVVIFALVFGTAAGLILVERPIAKLSQSGAFSAAGIVFLPPHPAPQGPRVPAPMLEEVTRILQRPFLAPKSLIVSSENCREARALLPEKAGEEAEQAAVSAQYLDEARQQLGLTVVGPSAETSRRYANAIMKRFTEGKNLALEQARAEALSVIRAGLAEVSKECGVTLEIAGQGASGEQASETEASSARPSAGTQLRDAAAKLTSLATGFDRVSDACAVPFRYSEAATDVVLSAEVGTPSKTAKLMLALVVAALAAVVGVLVVDSLSPPRASGGR